MLARARLALLENVGGCVFGAGSAPLKRWAIVSRPDGTSGQADGAAMFHVEQIVVYLFLDNKWLRVEGWVLMVKKDCRRSGQGVPVERGKT